MTHHLRGMAGGDGEPRGAAFERGDALLQHRIGRIADARIDVAEGLQAEQRGGVVDVLEHVGRGLIDRRGARAGGRVRLGAGVNRERGKAWAAVGHFRSSCCRDRTVRGSARWFIEARAAVKVGQRRRRPTALSAGRGPAPQSLRLARSVAPSHARGATATASRAGRAPSCWRSRAASSRLIRRATLQP